MAQRTSYSPGTFSWAELSTTDQAGAKAFYAGLFGWETEDSPIGDGVVYMMAKLQGRYVAAISPQPARQREADVPPMWNSYITVESADAALAAAGDYGATIHAPAFDVFDAGRMGVIQDPQGAYVMVWEPRNHVGAGLVNAHGALIWNELASPDPEASAAFYSATFGFTTEAAEGSDPPYLFIGTADGHSNGGIRSAASSEPCYWLVYFGSENLERSVAQAGELGGKTLVEPMEIPWGQIAAIQDPQGAVFGLYAGRFDD